MTVKLLGPWGLQPAGTLYTTDATTEAAMVAAKVATADLTGGVVYVPPGGATVPPSIVGGGGGGLTIGGGNDQIALTESGGIISGYTSDLRWVVNRDGEDVPTSIEVNGVPSISSTLTRVGTSDYFIVAGALYVGGRLKLTMAQYLALIAANTADPAATPIALGTAVLITGTNAAHINQAGVSTPVPAYKSWNGAEFVFDQPLVYNDCREVVHTGTLTETLLRTMPVVPMGLMGSFDSVDVSIIRDATGTAGTKTAKAFVNGSGSTNRIIQLALGATFLSGPVAKRLRHRGNRTEFQMFSFSNNGDNGAGTTVNMSTIALNTDAVDQTYTYSETLANVADSITLRSMSVVLSTDPRSF
jgi:hypothetical protein